jgi:hypothetical protein
MGGWMGSMTRSRRTFLFRTSHIHRKGSTLEIFVMKHLDGFGSFGRAGKFHKSKSSRFARKFVEHKVYSRNTAGLGEILTQVVFSRLIGEIAHEEFGWIHEYKKGCYCNFCSKTVRRILPRQDHGMPSKIAYVDNLSFSHRHCSFTELQRNPTKPRGVVQQLIFCGAVHASGAFAMLAMARTSRQTMESEVSNMPIGARQDTHGRSGAPALGGRLMAKLFGGQFACG